MQSHRRILPVVLVALALAGPVGAAKAGGAWRLRDEPKGYTVIVNGARMYIQPEGKQRREVLVFDHRQPLVTRSRYYGVDGDVQFAVRGGAILHHGVRVASLEAGLVRFERGSQADFDIRLRPGKGRRHGRRVWKLAVLREGEAVASGRAVHLIGRGKKTRPRQRQDILNRVRLYLAWRELLAGKSPLDPGDAGEAKPDEIAIGETARHCWEQGLERNPALMQGGTLQAAWRANPKGQLVHLELVTNPFSFDPGFARCFLSRARRYRVDWSPTGKPAITLEPVQ